MCRMQLLLVSDQCLTIQGETILANDSFANFLKRLAIMGELHLCVRKVSDTATNHLIYNQEVNAFVKKDNIHYIPKSYLWPSFNTLNTIKRQIEKVALVVGYLPSLNAEVAALYAHKLNKRFLGFMVACTWDGLLNQDFKRKIAAPYRYKLNRYVMKHADYALYVTHNFLQQRYPASAAKSLGLSDVVLNKTDESVLAKRLAKISNSTPDTNYIIATTAALNLRYKGQHIVLHALQKLKEKGFTNYKYYLIGGGNDRHLKKVALQLGISDRVEFLGKVTHKDVFKILDEIDIYIQPSLVEGMPRSVLEAMSRALPCIGTNTGDIPELLDQDFIVNKKSADEIVEKLLALTDRQIMTHQAERNFMKAQKYECEKLDHQREIFYKSIMEDFPDDESHQADY